VDNSSRLFYRRHARCPTDSAKALKETLRSTQDKKYMKMNMV